jgi:hypothetical protein
MSLSKIAPTITLAFACIGVPVHSQIQIPQTSQPTPTGPPMSVLPPQSLTTVPVSVSMDVGTLLAQILPSLPQGQDADGAWGVVGNDPAGNVAVKYKVWRDTPVIAISGSTVTLDLNMFYQFALAQRVRNGIFVGGYSWHQFASCGYGEPPRTAHIHFAYQLGWQNNFHLSAAGNSRVDYGPCNLTILNFDAIGKVKELVDPKVQDALNKLQGFIQDFDFRPQVVQIWAALQTPIHTPPLPGDLHITPVAIGASPLNGNGTTLSDTFVLTARTAIFSPLKIPGGPPADAFRNTVPPATLQVLPSPGNGIFRITLLGHLPFSDATAIAKQRLDGSPLDLMNLHSTLTVDEIGGNARTAWAKVRLDGGLQGTIFLTGVMAYDPATNEFSIQHLTLTPEEISTFTPAMVASFQDPAFLTSLEPNLRWDMGPSFANFRSDINTRIANADLGAGFVLHGQATSLAPTSLLALPTNCDPVFPAEMCKDGFTKAVFVISIEAEGSLSIVRP